MPGFATRILDTVPFLCLRGLARTLVAARLLSLWCVYPVIEADRRHAPTNYFAAGAGAHAETLRSEGVGVQYSVVCADQA